MEVKQVDPFHDCLFLVDLGDRIKLMELFNVKDHDLFINFSSKDRKTEFCV